MTAWLVSAHALPFWLAFAIGAVATAGAGLLFQFVVLRFAIGKPDFTIVMLNFGLATVVNAALDAKFGAVPVSNGDPWGSSVLHVGKLGLPWVQIWTIVTAVILLAAFWLFNRHSKYELAMRAAASDPESRAIRRHLAAPGARGRLGPGPARSPVSAECSWAVTRLSPARRSAPSRCSPFPPSS